MARAYPDHPVTVGNWTFCSHMEMALCVERAAEMQISLQEYLQLLVQHHHQIVHMRHYHA